MQTKTIRKIIENKLIEWLSTITEEQLRKDVKANLLVSGGSIASLFLKENVKDYDIYLQDKSVLLRLVRYYTKDIKDRIIVMTSENADEFERFKGAKGVASKNIANEQVKLYFIDDHDKGGIHLTDNENVKEDEYKLVFASPNALSLSNKIQIVTRFTGNADEIHATFDFVHATNYFTFNEGLVTNNAALISLLTKQLRYQGSRYPLTSIIRFKKFVKRGWSINAGEILKIMFQISEFDLTDVNVLEDQLIGVDVAYFATLIEILQGVDKSKISSGYLNTLIDKVFNDVDDNI